MLARLVRSDWGIYCTRSVVIACNFLALLAIATIMEADEFGRFAFMWSATLTLAAVASVGAPNLLMRELSAYQVESYVGVSLENALRLIFLWPALILVAIALALSSGRFLWEAALADWGVGTELNISGVIWLIAIAAFLIFLNNILGTFFRVMGRISLAMLLRDVGPQFLLVLAAVGLTIFDQPDAVRVFKWFLVLTFIALFLVVLLSGRRLGALLITIPNSRILKNNIKCSPGLERGSQNSKRNISPLAFWGSTVTTTLWAQVDILLAALFLPAATLGQYQILKRIANLSSVPQIVANWATVVPVGKAFATGNIEAVQSHCHRALRLSILPLLLLLTVTLICMPVIVAVFNIEMDASLWVVVALLLTSSAANVLAGPNFTVAAQCHLENAAFLARIMGVAITAGVILAVGSFGIIAVSAAVLSGSVVANILIWKSIRQSIQVDTSVVSIMRRRSQD